MQLLIIFHVDVLILQPALTGRASCVCGGSLLLPLYLTWPSPSSHQVAMLFCLVTSVQHKVLPDVFMPELMQVSRRKRWIGWNRKYVGQIFSRKYLVGNLIREANVIRMRKSDHF